MARLFGLKQIADYEQKSEKVIRRLIAEKNFPAAKIGREYESDTDLIEKWRKSLIQNGTNGSDREGLENK